MITKIVYEDDRGNTQVYALNSSGLAISDDTSKDGSYTIFKKDGSWHKIYVKVVREIMGNNNRV